MSFNVMFVDDEPWALKGIAGIIDWSEYGFSIAGKFEDSTEALEYMRQNPPDAVFVDIRMPTISGIELMKKAREEGLQTEFVVVSGFREFSYAQEAMDYGAFSYIVKPLNREIMMETASKLFKRLRESRKQLSEKIAYSLFNENQAMETDHDIVQKLGSILAACSSEVMAVALVEDVSGESEAIKRLYADLADKGVKIGRNKYFFILTDGRLPQYIPDVAGTPEGRINAGLSTTFHKAADMEKALKEARLASCSSFVTGKRGIYRYEPADTKQAVPFIDEVRRACSENDVKKIKSVLDSFYEYASGTSMGIENVVFFYNQIVAALISKYPSEKTNEFVFMDYMHLYNSYTSFRSLCDNIYYMALELSQQDSDSIPQAQENKAFQEVLEYVEDNFDKDIYMDEVAKKFHISPSHFSRMFKKAAGKTFTEYLLQIRMTRACRLIRSTDMSISAIAESVGYPDYFYFNRMFKKYCGTTPVKYRKGEDLDGKA